MYRQWGLVYTAVFFFVVRLGHWLSGLQHRRYTSVVRSVGYKVTEYCQDQGHT
jgi:hypothetical protein